MTITLKKYSPSYKVFIQTFLNKHKMDMSLADDLPRDGFIAFVDELPVAAGFLRRVEGNYGLLDSYISNPEAEAAHRNAALDLITEKLLKVAQTQKYRKLIVFSSEVNILIRASKHGFISLPYGFFMKEMQSA